MMQDQKATIHYNRQVAPDHYCIGLHGDHDFGSARPGQFVMLRVADQLYPLLRRPFSIHRLVKAHGRPTGFEILYRVVGQGTTLLSARQKGERLDVLGPLGTSFRLPRSMKRPFIVGGGIGVAPLVFLAEQIASRLENPSDGFVFLGALCDEALLCRNVFEKLGMSLKLATDDGSCGDQCLVTDPVEEALTDREPDILFACGPSAMLACVADIARRHRIPCQISLEAHMACGMGACLGCAVPQPGQSTRYLHVCQDGPVFDAEDVII
jgi:dihydroorotate dehydrogenase electron transfer subunit